MSQQWWTVAQQAQWLAFQILILLVSTVESPPEKSGKRSDPHISVCRKTAKIQEKKKLSKYICALIIFAFRHLK